MVWSWLSGNIAMWVFAVASVLGGLSLLAPSNTVSDWLKMKITDEFSWEMVVGLLVLVSGIISVWALLVG